MSEIKEPIGFICRWLLLLTAMTMLLGVTWIALLSTAAMSTDLRADIAVSDYICARTDQRDILMRADPYPELSYPNSVLVMGVFPENRIKIATPYKGRFYLRSSRDRSGLKRIEFTGTPYGPMAFRSRTSLLQIVEPNRRVFFIDSDVLLEEHASQYEDQQTALRWMFRYGEVCYLLQCRLENYHARRRELRKRIGERPIVHLAEDVEKSARTLLRQRSRLNPESKKKAPSPVLLTNKSDLAYYLGSRGYPTFWIDGDPKRAEKHGRIAVPEKWSDVGEAVQRLNKREAPE